MPNIERHDTIELSAHETLSQMGYLTDRSKYFETLPPTHQTRLKTMYGPTSLFLRTRADRIAIHKSKPIVFEWEYKIAESPNYNNMAVEALPFLHHLRKGELGVKCLYMYDNPHSGQSAGFWAHDAPKPFRLIIPQRWEQWTELHQYFRTVLQNAFGLPAEMFHVSGSGDPFVLIHADILDELPTWQHLLQTYTDNTP